MENGEGSISHGRFTMSENWFPLIWKSFEESCPPEFAKTLPPNFEAQLKTFIESQITVGTDTAAGEPPDFGN